MAAPVRGTFETCRDFWGGGGGLLGCCVEDIWAEEDESEDHAVESELSFKREMEPWWLRPSNMGIRGGS